VGDGVYDSFIYGYQWIFWFVAEVTFWTSELVRLKEASLLEEVSDVANLLRDWPRELLFKRGKTTIALLVDVYAEAQQPDVRPIYHALWVCTEEKYAGIRKLEGGGVSNNSSSPVKKIFV